MPLYKSYKIAHDTKLLVWKITESLEELSEGTVLKNVCEQRLMGMKSEQHRKGFMSVRKLLAEAGYSDLDLFYTEDGKPHLTDGKNISITHSYSFSAIIISNRSIGIDMEIRREKVIRIADKFVEKEFGYLDQDNTEDYVRRLIVIWGVKEALYKMFSRQGLSFKQNIDVDSFKMEDLKGTATVHFEEINSNLPFYFEEIEDFTLVYSIDNN
ncbi:4'-phosphopantetheinyl transferase superfamily protein [Flavobacterium alkalisoli]|uniref:4'-phosphopantetheinyl transferase superfamily protein n=1 Tax=Flavobacterium alkalisoli TaxID=2602769 RepID=A0A5B9FPY5_9FLAO|nr:4'-phosphopantetheinyl transferase superfamily protein [Flavobacterium alkalisoli]QEE48389.1 4'-phosphopantetheinyl transferase superfamily protein [Flavobacterium alkalisoli]